MDPFGGAPHSFPRANGDPEVRRGRLHLRRSRKRLPRPPAWVRRSLVTLQHSSSTTTTTTSRSHVQHHSPGTLLPITRFCSPEDIRNTTDGQQPTSAIMDHGSSKDILLFLLTASENVREQVFWGICLQVFEFLKHQPLNLQSPWLKLFLSRLCPVPQMEVVLHHFTNRYRQEYEEEEELGRGGFGRVVRARNKRDGCYYAVKMIITDDMGESPLEACLQEVRTLAKLDHPRVVRYYYNWVQEDVWSQHQQWSSATLSSYSSDDNSEDSSSDNSVSAHLPQTGQGGTPPDDGGVVFQDTGTGEVEACLPPPGIYPRQTQGQRHSQNSSKAGGSLLPYRPRLLPQLRKILYIQMKLYGKSLRKWMDDRNNSDSPVVVKEECLRIFHQVLEAMCYIHDQGYMHRDIKPENILFGLKGSDVHLGDFGLARLIAHPPSASSHTSPKSNTYTRNVGTPSYSAPEVKYGNYGEKSDMYSLGIILLELFMPFKTVSEKFFVLTNLKEKDDLDPDLPPAIAYWIKKLVDKNPAERPSARELLESSLFLQPEPPPSPTSIIGETFAGGLPMKALALTSEMVEATTTTIRFTRSECTSVSSVEVNQINGAESVNNCTVQIEECLSKDEKIALLKEENDALKRMVEELQRDLKRRCKESLSKDEEIALLKGQKEKEVEPDLEHCKIGNAAQAD